ncbi:putative phosphate transporter family protein [Cardiosporidium cionae]|uniref:Phosphate transporter n=1 Tax=Cardiosporidium cionae TaxID=476202 RepID=A0ABQ7JBJ8_9APIC|nr:putative phosphate transporter family protein [Cardiosporidium cionae]|eukprot:KAF8821341.1 putative phosphate transporter family protein [Cardiosporidium cionae]
MYELLCAFFLDPNLNFLATKVIDFSRIFVNKNISMAAENFIWIVVAGSIAAFMTAFAIGANDVANTFSTAVGGKSLSLKTAIILGSLFEIIGATLLGSAVTDTIRKNIIGKQYFSVFDDSPGILMLGMLCSLVGSGFWVLIATHLALPVSTTHSIVGSLIGFGIAAGKFGAIHWSMIGIIVLCWLCAPFVAGLFGALCFGSIRSCILRRTNALQRGCRALLLLMLLICATFSYFFIFHNPFILSFSCSQVSNNGNIETFAPCSLSRWAKANMLLAFATVLLLTTLLAGLLSVGAYYLVLSKLKNLNSIQTSEEIVKVEIEASDADFSKYLSSNTKFISDDSERQKTTSFETVCSESNMENSLDYTSISMPQTPDPQPSGSEKPSRSRNSSWITLGWMDSPYDLENDTELVRTIQSSAEEFSEESECFFSACQVGLNFIFSACLGCLAHSTNDTANAIGPLSVIYFSYIKGSVATMSSVPWYIFFCGGCSMALGLIFLGHKVVNTMGNKLVKITPSRGFSIDVGAAWVVMLFSIFGIPLSTTHGTVGSTVGVGLIERGVKNSGADASLDSHLHLNWKLLTNIFLSWIVTLIFSGMFLIFYKRSMCTTVVFYGTHLSFCGIA